jgi:hypothetical protein
MEPQQQCYDTFARMLLTRQYADMAPCAKHPAPPLYGFFTSLYEDMLTKTDEYHIPSDPFVSFIARVSLTPEETAQHEELKTTLLRVRNPMIAYFEFLRDLGLAGEPSGSDLRLLRTEFNRLVGECTKKTKNRRFLTTLERTGLSFSDGDPVVISNNLYPVMPAELAIFSHACARLKDYQFYFFRRCDLAVLDGKTTPDIEAVLQVVPQPFQSEVAETDRRLMQMRFKREIFVANVGSTYFLRYNKKNNQVVYWVRIFENWQPDLHHNLYWKFKTDLTPSLLNRLEETAPGLGVQVFERLKACIRCYPVDYCMDRTPIEWNGREKVVCKNTGWNKIGYEHDNYEKLWAVLSTFNELV